MGTRKSKAIPRAFWLGLVVLGAMTARSDPRLPRPARDEVAKAGVNTRTIPLVTPALVSETARDQVWSTLRP